MYYLFNEYTGLNFSNYDTLLIQPDMDVLEMLYRQNILAFADFDRPEYADNRYLNRMLLTKEQYQVFVPEGHRFFHEKEIQIDALNNEEVIIEQTYDYWVDNFIQNYKTDMHKRIYDYYSYINAIHYTSSLIFVIKNDKAVLAELEFNALNWTKGIKARLIPVVGYNPREVYLWWLQDNDAYMKKLTENIDIMLKKLPQK